MLDYWNNIASAPSGRRHQAAIDPIRINKTEAITTRLAREVRKEAAAVRHN